MTFQFAHMAPPGAPHHRHRAANRPVARWLRCARTSRPVMHWTPSQATLERVFGSPVETPLDALLCRQSELRAA